MTHITTAQALAKLKQEKELFKTLFKHGTLEVEIYQPHKIDHQSPHSRDEVYVVISGHGDFKNGSMITSFGPGDFLFVKAGVEHRFLNFSDDFCTWVIFYGPEGGE